MEQKRATFSFIGIFSGAAALILITVYTWAGPFSGGGQSLEDNVADMAASLTERVRYALSERESEAISNVEMQSLEVTNRYTIDRILLIAAAVSAALALIFSAVGFAANEPLRAAGSAAALGTVALAFQYLLLIMGFILFVTVVFAALKGFFGD
jgi:hypothetical protein